MSRSDNAKKGQVKSCETPRNGRHVIISNGDTSLEFISICAAAQHIFDNSNCKSTSGSISRKLAEIANGKTNRKSAHGWKCSYVETEPDILPGEVWKTLPFDECKSMISNKGRYKNSYGHFSKGYCSERIGKYRSVTYTFTNSEGKSLSVREYLHKLVWITFNGLIPDGMDVMHDDAIDLDEDGCKLNDLEHLSIGTRTQKQS